MPKNPHTIFVGAALFLAGAGGVSIAADKVSVEASPRGTAVEISARATIKAPYELIWQTLTDYDHLSDFIPGMEKSHVIERRGSSAIVKQTGSAGVLFFRYPIEVVVESFEEPPDFIGVRVINGNLKQLDGGYRIEKAGANLNEYVLRWSGIIEPSIPVPLFISVPLMQTNISDQFRGMVSEIERREMLRAIKQARE